VCLWRHYASPELERPKHFENTTWVVIVKANQSHEGGFIAVTLGNMVHQPLAMPCVDRLPLHWQVVRSNGWRAIGWLARINAGGLENERLKVRSRA
jgi:hypothetical protein